jgi:hypothetical protein
VPKKPEKEEEQEEKIQGEPPKPTNDEDSDEGSSFSGGTSDSKSSDAESPTRKGKDKVKTDNHVRKLYREKKKLYGEYSPLGECVGETLTSCCAGWIILIGIIVAIGFQPTYQMLTETLLGVKDSLGLK